VDGKWAIEEFRLPHHDVVTQVGKDGVWRETGKRHVAD
jgi:hypothetical protein